MTAIECSERSKNLDCACLDNDRILAFGKKYGILSDVVEKEVIKALEEIKKDKDYISLCSKLLYHIKNNIPLTSLEPNYEDGLKAQYAIFFPVWYMAENSAEDMKKRGISHSIISKSFKGICDSVVDNKILCGRMGTSEYFFWLRHYALGDLFMINDFQYEIKKHDGKATIAIHIPEGTKLDVSQNLLSFKEALDFFETYYPELEISGFSCESWLLSKEIEEVMGRKTNISRFGDMFERYDINDIDGDSAYRFVYKTTPPYPSIDELPENTTLQKRLKEYMRSGKKLYAYGGFISKAKLFDMLSKEIP